jgi:hypothetical protein
MNHLCYTIFRSTCDLLLALPNYTVSVTEIVLLDDINLVAGLIRYCLDVG